MKFFLQTFILLLFYCLNSISQFVIDANIEFSQKHVNKNYSTEFEKFNSEFENKNSFHTIRTQFLGTYKINTNLDIETKLLFDNGTQKKFFIEGIFAAIYFSKSINFRVGKIPIPIGNYSKRNFSHKTILFTIPSIYQMQSPINSTKIYYQICDANWLNGISLIGSYENFNWNFMLAKNSFSNPNSTNLQFASRIYFPITENISFGTSLANSNYINNKKHKIYAVDIHSDFYYFEIFAEGFLNEYESEKNLFQNLSYYGEINYHLNTNISFALRYDEIKISSDNNKIFYDNLNIFAKKIEVGSKIKIDKFILNFLYQQNFNGNNKFDVYGAKFILRWEDIFSEKIKM